MPGTIRVGVVDDHPSILAAISAAIDAEPDLTLSGTGRTLADAIELLARSDVLLCDVQLEESDGLRVLEAASQADPAPAVLLISGHDRCSGSDRCRRWDRVRGRRPCRGTSGPAQPIRT